MQHYEAIQRAKEVAALAGLCNLPDAKNFLEYSAIIAYGARNLTYTQRQTLPWFTDWAHTWRDLADRFDNLVTADPMMLYEPAHSVSLEFHSSPAYIRYYRAGNRASKTQSGYAEHYFVTTGQHKWRWFPQPANSTFIVAGLPFTTYAPGVFEKKFLSGEDANPLSPMFPEGGKWFYHYDQREHCITLACPVCANAGKAGSCPHPKSTIKLFSNENGWEVLQGASYLLGHFDEHVNEDFFNEARQRTKTVPGGGLLVTGTPLHGYEAWEHRKLTKIFEAGPPLNRVDPDNKESPPLVSLHQIDQFSAGLVPHDQIKMEMALMDKFEVDSRIYGRPAPLAKNPVFDRHALQAMEQLCKPPQRGELQVKPIEGRVPQLIELLPGHPIDFCATLDGALRVWKGPEQNEVYIAAVDTAGGLLDRTDQREGDASCCSILRMYSVGNSVALELVAQWHGWLTPYDYADEIFKLATWYNSSTVVIELTGGLGVAVVQRLRNDHGYWNIYREPQDLAAVKQQLDPRLGVDTNMSTKPFMIAVLKQFIKERKLHIYDSATISELTAFEQQTTGAGGSILSQPRYRGAGGSKDDRVMSLAIGCVTAVTYAPILGQLVFKDATLAKGKTSAITVSKDMQKVYADLELQNKSTLDG